ncbi:hypothetical protein [Citrobacter portucalensis]|uniref:hypothetical protein n=1 Tax=Citrobacter portucalensis TaxID=1639133 RepID=UPI0023B10A45|nr:hypothetical protein [Citrobacter portucalensis]
MSIHHSRLATMTAEEFEAHRAAGFQYRSERGLRSNDVKNHDKKITCCFYLKKAETFLLLMFFNFSP